MKYIPRIADNLLKRKLSSSPAVLIRGAKWCGKSTTAMQEAKSCVFMQDPEKAEQYESLARTAPSKFLQGAAPRLIDEWQTIPFIYDAIRFEADRRGEFGNFILTGSATPEGKSQIKHSGTGRIATLTMRPMTLSESLDSDATYSIRKLFDGEYPEGGFAGKTIEDYAYLLCRGGFPLSVGKTRETGLDIPRNYYNSIVENELVHDYDKEKMRLVMRSYARYSAAEPSIAMIEEDVAKGSGLKVSDNSIISYLNALRSIFVIEDLPAWNPNLRSTTAIRTTPTRHFADPSIAAASLGIGPDDLFNDMRTFGLLFETMAVRDLRTYAEANDGSLYHYRDKNGLEADAVIHLKNGKWAAFEVKLGNPSAIEKGAANLLKLASLIDESAMKGPSFLAVITATEVAYRREDGVFVLPLGCLSA
jgi:uncharacterized protein